MKSVLYDHQIFSSQQWGGISKYFVHLAESVAAMADFEVSILAPLFVNRHLEASDQARVTGRYVPAMKKTARIRSALCGAMTTRALRSRAPDVLHQTFFEPNYRVPKSTRIVTTLYDMIPERLYRGDPYWAGAIESKAEAVRRADHVFCISERTMRDALEIIGGSEEKYSVTYLGCESPGREDAPAGTIGFPYLLYVGSRAWYKNFGRFLRAFAMSRPLRSDSGIVCAGGGKLSASEAGLVSSLGLAGERVVQMDVDDTQMTSLYRGALALVYPSEYEGFGLPPLEAMAAGCPVICSGASAMPEVVADAGEYFDPMSEESMRAAIERVAASPSLRAGMIARGRIRARDFTWERCAGQAARVYRSIC